MFIISDAFQIKPSLTYTTSCRCTCAITSTTITHFVMVSILFSAGENGAEGKKTPVHPSALNVLHRRRFRSFQIAPVALQPVSELRDPVAFWTPAALIHDLLVLQYVEALKIGAVRRVRRVLHGVHDHGAPLRLAVHELRGAESVLQTAVPRDLVRRVGTHPAV